jgi:hypothetical protein
VRQRGTCIRPCQSIRVCVCCLNPKCRPFIYTGYERIFQFLDCDNPMYVHYILYMITLYNIFIIYCIIYYYYIGCIIKKFNNISI